MSTLETTTGQSAGVDAFRLDRKVAVVTGGLGGYGAAVARMFAELGAAGVALLDIRTPVGVSVVDDVRQHGADCVALEVDIDDEAAVAAAAATVRERFGRCDVLVNNAGVVTWSPLEDLSVEEWDHSMAVNLRGHFLCTKHFGRLMLDAGRGSIINLTSVAATIPEPGGGAYSPAKAGAVMLARQVAVEWGRRGVRANAVCPGLVRGPMSGAFHADAASAATRRQMVPLGRFGDASELARVIAFLASDASSFVNGEMLHVDGGFGQMLIRALPHPGVYPDLFADGENLASSM